MTIKERIGFGFVPANARQAVDLIGRAEAAGVATAWTVMPALGRDTLTIFAAAAMTTERIRFGTAIVPAFTRHPLAIVTQAMALEDLAPGRLRLGLGTSHQRTMIPVYGVPFDHPLARLREYLAVVRSLLRDGAVSFAGEFYQVEAKIPVSPGTPVPISALGEKSFELAGEVADGAISWLCPVEYLVAVGKPALLRGAAAAGRSAPPLIAHALVCPRTDPEIVRSSARAMLAYYAGAEFYRRMWAAAGFHLGPNHEIPDALIDALVISGDEATIATALHARLAAGFDELLVSLVPGDDPRRDEDTLFRVIGGL